MSYLGLKYPLVKGQQGFFESTNNTFENERFKLLNLMNTMETERYMFVKYGLNMIQFIFEPNTPELRQKIESHIRQKISLYTPNIIINELVVEVDNTDIDKNTIKISLDYSVNRIKDKYDVLSFEYS